MVRRPDLFKYLPIRLRIFNCWDAFLQISDICLSKFRWESTVMPESLTFSERALRFIYEDYENTYENLLKKSKLPSLKIRRLRTIAVETFKIIHKQSPSYLHDLISM
jgi:hypothetical protein